MSDSPNHDRVAMWALIAWLLVMLPVLYWAVIVTHLENYRLRQIKISPQGRWLSRQDSRGISVHELKSGNTVMTSTQHYGSVFSRDDQIALMGNRKISLWELNHQARLQQCQSKTVHVRSMFFKPNGSLVVDSYGAIGEWNWTDCTQPSVNQISHDGYADAIAWSSTGRMIALGNRYSIGIWDWQRREKLYRLEGKARTLMRHLEFSSDERFVAAAMTDGVRIWSLDDGKLVLWLKVGDASSVALTANGERVALITKKGVVLIGDVASGETQKLGYVGDGENSAVRFVSMDTQLVAAGAGGTARVFDLATQKIIKTLTGLHQPAPVSTFLWYMLIVGAIVWSVFCSESKRQKIQ